MKVTVDVDDKEANEVIEGVFLNDDIIGVISYWASVHHARPPGAPRRFTDEDGISFTMNKALAKKCLGKLVYVVGGSLQNADSCDYDSAVQLAVFGKFKYG